MQHLLRSRRHIRGLRRVSEPRSEHAPARGDVFGELPSARPHAHHHPAARRARPCDRYTSESCRVDLGQSRINESLRH